MYWILSLVLGAFGGIATSAFFAIIKRNTPANVMEGHPEFLGYGSVQDLVYGQGRRVIRYCIFRFTPAILMGILICGIMNKAQNSQSSLPALLTMILTSNAPGSLRRLLARDTWTRERLAHAIVLAALILIASLTSWSLDGTELIKKVTPTLQGFVDNAWSTLLIALTVGYFFKVTQTKPDPLEWNTDVRRRLFIRDAYRGIEEKFGNLVRSLNVSCEATKEILLAILTYENLNRPGWWRATENLLVKIPGVELTVGISQVRSARALSNEDSIELALLALDTHTETPEFVELEDDREIARSLIKHHNPSPSYVREVEAIWDATRDMGMNL